VVDGVGEVGQRIGQRAIEVEQHGAKVCFHHGVGQYNNRLDLREVSL
jgi:hypothetical protein